MKIINIEVVFKDRFSGATMKKAVTRSEDTFQKMKNGIGQVVRTFENGIAWEWEVVEVNQAQP
jgi:hypothetical protein